MTERALIAVPDRAIVNSWPAGSSVIFGTSEVVEETESLGEFDPEELGIAYPVKCPAHACLVVWEGDLNPIDGWRGKCRPAHGAELVSLQLGTLLEYWAFLDGVKAPQQGAA